MKLIVNQWCEGGEGCPRGLPSPQDIFCAAMSYKTYVFSVLKTFKCIFALIIRQSKIRYSCMYSLYKCVSMGKYTFLYGDWVLELQIPFLGYLTAVCLCQGSTAPFNSFHSQCFLQSLAPRTVLIWEKSITLIGSEVGSIMIQAVVFISIFPTDLLSTDMSCIHISLLVSSWVVPSVRASRWFLTAWNS